MAAWHKNIKMAQSSAFFNAYFLYFFFTEHIVNPTEFGGVLGRDVVLAFLKWNECGFEYSVYFAESSLF